MHCFLIILTTLWAYGGGLDIYPNGPGLFPTAVSLQHSINTFGQPEYWRPLSWCIYRMLHAVSWPNFLPYHVLDLTIHSLNALLVYYVAMKLSKDGVVALAAGLMFAAFYCHAGLLFGSGLFQEHGSAFFCLVAIASFLHFQDTDTRSYLIVSLSSIIIALLIRESALVAFPIIVSLDQLYRPRPLPRVRRGLILWLAGIGVVYVIAKMHFTTSPAGSVSAWLSPLKDWGVVNMLKQMNMAMYLTISDVCPGRDMRGVFYVGFILFIWKSTTHRRLAVTALTLLIISVLPLFCSFGLLDRYVYLPSAFSVILLATVIRYSAVALADRIVPSYARLGTGLVTGVVLLLIVCFNAHKIHVLEVQYRAAGNLLRTNLEDITMAFPNGTEGLRLYLINNPMDLPRNRSGTKEYSHYLHPKVWDHIHNVDWVLQLFYGRPQSVGEVKELTVDLGYPISEHRQKVSNEELDCISRDPRDRIMVFNPYTRHLVDMTGKTSQEIRVAIGNSKR